MSLEKLGSGKCAVGGTDWATDDCLFSLSKLVEPMWVNENIQGNLINSPSDFAETSMFINQCLSIEVPVCTIHDTELI